MNKVLKTLLNLSRDLKDFVISKFQFMAQMKPVKQQQKFDQKLITSLREKKLPRGKQFKYISKVLSKKEKRIIQLLSGIIILSIVFLAYTFFSDNIITTPKHGGELTEGLVGSPLYINPILAQTNDVDLDLSRLLFSGLMKYNENLELVPDLAEKYDVSEDQKTYTFYLRQNVKWHDGKPFSASDVVFTIQSIQDEEYKSPLYRTFKGVGIEKVDDFTVKFTLGESYAAFLNVLTVGIIPQHLWFDIPAINAKLSVYNQKPFGTGPYKFKSLIKESSGVIKAYTLEKNKDYYGKMPYIDKIIFKFYPEYLAALEALKNKNIESLGYLNKESIEQLEGKRKTTLFNVPLSQLTAVFFNEEKNQLLGDEEFRQALAYAIDKNKIVESVLKSQGQAIYGPILPGFLGFTEDIDKYEYNPQHAADILLDDGWELEGEFLKKDDTELKITLTTVDQPENVKTVELIKTYWNNIGVNVDLQIIPRSQIEKDYIIPRNYEALLYGEIIGYDPDPYPFWHSTQRDHPGVNLTSYGNRKVDTILEEARQISNIEERSAKYQEFQTIIADDLPAVFIYNPTYTYPLSSKVKGVNIQRISVASDRFIGIENWYIKTKKSLK